MQASSPARTAVSASAPLPASGTWSAPPWSDNASPVVAAAIPHIGHFQIRNRGTVGCSSAHADPAAEIPALCRALNAQFVVADADGERTVPAGEFFLGLLTTAVEPDQLLVRIQLPGLTGRWNWGFQEVSRRHGDFALAGAIALLRLDEQAVCLESRITMFGVATPRLGQPPPKRGGAGGGLRCP